MNKVSKLKLSSFDYETTGLSPYHGARVFSYCIGWPIYDSNSECIDCAVEVRRLDTPSSEINQRNRKYLEDYWADTNIIKIIHNAKFEIHFTKMEGISIPSNTIIHDTMIMSQLLRNLNPSHTLDYLCWELCGYPRDLDSRVKVSFKATNSYQTVKQSLMYEYQVADGERPLLLYFTFIKQLMGDKRLCQDYLNEIEVIKATQIEEERGIQLHSGNIEKLHNWLEEELDKVSRETYELTNEWINLNSDKQIARLLYKKLGFEILKFTDGFPPQPSTDKDTLFDLQRKNNHPIFNLIHKQRSYQKAISTIESYIELADNNLRIHPNQNTNRARTGRKASSKPNLQNVSKEAALKNPFPVPLRKCFRPSKGYVFIPVDYSGIEMRLIVELSKEPELIKLLKKNPDADLHHLTLECFMMDGLFNTKNDEIYQSGIINAAKLRNENPKKYKIERGAYKNTGFGKAFGAGKEKLSITLNKPVEEISDGHDNYCNRFQCIADFNQNQIQQVRAHGYITTSFGRKLYVPRDKAYIGSNYLIQGTAAGILKRAQVKLQKLLSTKKMYKNIHIVLDIHDEIIFEYPRNLLKYKNEILSEFNQVMIDMPEITVPLRCEFSICTTSWNEKIDLEVKLD